jgi:subtilisin
MYYAIFPVLTIIVLAPFLQISPYTTVIVSFVKGRYDPAIVESAGGKGVKELRDLDMLKAIIPGNELASLAHNPAIEFIETDGHSEIADENTTIEYSASWGLQDIGVEPAHSLNYTGKGVKIAVLDTGIDYTHPDLAPNYKGGYDFINNDDDPMDDNGHGTHVAGILAAARDGKGIVGVAPDAELYAVKVSDNQGKGSFSGLIEGINWAIENHMNVVTMSITGQGGSQALAKAVDTAYGDGLILLAAVGNGVGNSNTILYPAGYDDVIGVGSVDKENNLSLFSLTGSDVEFVGPGSGIKSTWLDGKYAVLSGTSMATPFVTGTIALLLGSNEKAWNATGAVNGDGKWTNEEIREVLRNTAKDLGANGKDNSYGYGLVNLHFPEKIESAIALAAVDENRKVQAQEGPTTWPLWLKPLFLLLGD